MKSGTLNWERAVWLVILGWLTLPVMAQPLRLVSTTNPLLSAAGGNGDSVGPILSADGRYVLFASTANNLATNSSGNPIPTLSPPRLNVYLRDRASGTITLVSVNLAGSGGGDGDSVPRQISTNGQYVLFESSASDLAPGATNHSNEVFLRDLGANTTALVSIGTDGTAGNGSSRDSVMTPDGRYVAFVSEANNLVADDTNHIPDIFVCDRQGEVTRLVSVGAMSPTLVGPSFVGASASPVITPDGRYVAFFSSATNLVSGTPGYSSLSQNIGEVYVRDLAGGNTVWASSYASNALVLLGVTNAISYNQVISDDGQFVAYEAAQRDSSTVQQAVVLRYNTASGVTDIVNTNAVRTGAGFEAVTRNLDATPDGRFIAYIANAAGNVGTNTCVEVWDGQSGTSILASGDPSGVVPGNAVCDSPLLDGSGRFVAFACSAALTTNAVVGSGLSGSAHLYVRDLQAEVTQLVDADTNGVGAVVAPATAPSLSADGRFVAFESRDSSLTPNDRNHVYDVFVRDLLTNTVELVSVHNDALGSWSANDATLFGTLSVSADGSRVAFASEADNLVANDTNGWRDVFVHDFSTGSNLLVSAEGAGQASGNGLSTDPSISADGRYVAFSSSANNLVAGDTNNAEDVFVRDLAAQTTILVSKNKTGTGPGNAASYSPSISASGRYVLFRSQATDLANGFFVNENLFLCDRQSGTNYGLTTTGVALSGGRIADDRYVAFVVQATRALYVWDAQAARIIYGSSLPLYQSVLGLIPYGPCVAYVPYTNFSQLGVVDRVALTNRVIDTATASPYFPSHMTVQFSRDGRSLVYAINKGSASRATNAVYLFDALAATNLLVSHSLGSAQLANGSSDSPAISPDGRFVAYRSVATDLALGASNGAPHRFLYDRASGTNLLLTANGCGEFAADSVAVPAVFSSDGKTLVFSSWAGGMVTNDFNGSADAFTYDLYFAGLVNEFEIRIIGSAAPGGAQTITWPVASGKSYQVQYKDNLGEPNWRVLSGSISVVGNQAYATDPAPSAQRFYRVLSF